MNNMLVHASISENKTIKGKAGDQTSKEVCIREYYAKGWNVMLRYKNSTVAGKIADIAVKLANSNLVGYSQTERNTLYNKLRECKFDVDKYIKKGYKTNCDCSSFIYACCCCVIPAMRMNSNAPTTRTMKNFFKKYGFKVFTNSKYLTTDKELKKGDILIKEGSHTVMNITTTKKS